MIITVIYNQSARTSRESMYSEGEQIVEGDTILQCALRAEHPTCMIFNYVIIIRT